MNRYRVTIDEVRSSTYELLAADRRQAEKIALQYHNAVGTGNGYPDFNYDCTTIEVLPTNQRVGETLKWSEDHKEWMEPHLC